MTNEQKHRHIWNRYMDGWACPLCGKKSGYDYTNDPKNGRPKE